MVILLSLFHWLFLVLAGLGSVWSLDECRFFRCSRNFRTIIRFSLDQFVQESSISVILTDCIRPPCNRGVSVFTHIGTYYFSCFEERHIPLVFHLRYLFFYFCRIRKILRKPSDFVGGSHILLPSSDLWSRSFLPDLCVVLFRLLCRVHTFGIWSTSVKLGCTVQPFLHNRELEMCGWMNVRMLVLVSIYFLFSNNYSFFMFMTSCFPRAADIFFVAKANSLFLITPLEVLSFSCGSALNLVVWNVFILNILSACL